MMPSQMMLQNLLRYANNFANPDDPPRLVQKGEQRAPVKGYRTLTEGERRALREQGRPDLADAEYHPSEKQWIIAKQGGKALNPNQVSSEQRNASDGQGWVEGRVPDIQDLARMQGVMGDRTRTDAPALTPLSAEDRKMYDTMLGNSKLSPTMRSSIENRLGADTELVKPLAPLIQTLGGTEGSTGGIARTVPLTMDSPQAKVNPEGTIATATRSPISNIAHNIAGNVVNRAMGGLSNILGGGGQARGGGGDDSRPMRIGKPQFDMGGIGDEYIARAAQGMKMFRRGGRLLPGEEGIVAEDTKHPEHIYNNDGVVEVTPLKPPTGQAEPYGLDQTIRFDDSEPNLNAVNDLARIAELSKVGVKAPADRESMADVGEGSQRAQIPTESLLQSVQNNADEDIPLPPRQSYIDTARIIAENARGGNPNDPGLLDARENVLKEDAWNAMQKPVKGSLLKSLGVGALQLLRNRVLHEDKPIVGWRDYQRQKELLPIAQKLKVIQAQKAAQQTQMDAEMKRKLNQSLIDDRIFDNREKEADRLRKIDDRISRERTVRMTQVAGILKSLPEFIPGDPKYKELEDALGDVNLPVTEKDAKKKVDLKQDQRTGEWTAIITNPVTGQQEVRPVLKKDGTVLKTTPTVVMQGEYGLLKQNDAQEHQTEENAKNRAQQMDIFLKGYAERIAKEKSANIFKAQSELQKLNEDLQNGVIDQDTYNQMVNILNAGLK